VSAHLGAVFELPLSSRLRDAEQQRALLALDAAEERLRAAELSIEAQARTQAARVAAARQRVALAQRTAEVARRLVEAERARFALGTTTPLQVLTAEDSLRSAELRVARAQVDARLASLALAHLTGELLSEHRGAIAARSTRSDR
jgi:outer membrane protein